MRRPQAERLPASGLMRQREGHRARLGHDTNLRTSASCRRPTSTVNCATCSMARSPPPATRAGTRRGAWNLEGRPGLPAPPAHRRTTWSRSSSSPRRTACASRQQGTGHGAGAIGTSQDTILVPTSSMRGVTIDPEARIARAEAGVIWIEVVEAAAEHGLAALAGSSRTSASSATRSGAASRGSPASTASAPTR